MSQKSLLKRIRESDNQTKKKLIAVSSIVVMIIIIAVWLTFLDSIIKPASGVNANQKSGESEFWSIMKTGLNIIAGTLKEKISGAISKIKSEREIIIEK